MALELNWLGKSIVRAHIDHGRRQITPFSLIKVWGEAVSVQLEGLLHR